MKYYIEQLELIGTDEIIKLFSKDESKQEMGREPKLQYSKRSTDSSSNHRNVRGSLNKATNEDKDDIDAEICKNRDHVFLSIET